MMVLLDALYTLESVKVGGELIELPYEWGEEFAMNLGCGYRATEEPMSAVWVSLKEHL